MLFKSVLKTLTVGSLLAVALLLSSGKPVSAQASPTPNPCEQFPEQCVSPSPEPDVCPNLNGIQTEVPQGYFINNDGFCVQFSSPTPDPCVENENCPTSTPNPTPEIPTCSENQHLDASGLRCTEWSQSGGGDNGGGSNNSGGNGGSVLGASTVLGATGNTGNIIGLSLIVLGLGVTSTSLYAYSKNKYN